jgi:hypothetical protein
MNNLQEKNKLVTFDNLSVKSKDYALWDIEQQNKVAKHMELLCEEVTKSNSLFYENGVWAMFI